VGFILFLDKNRTAFWYIKTHPLIKIIAYNVAFYNIKV